MRKLFGIIAIAAVTVVTAAAGWNFSQDRNNIELSDLVLANVEALANGEGSGSCNWATRETSWGWEAICISGGPGYSCTCGDVKPYY